jgi:tRNA A-37 threonylcarbamoyl transferase component Bud32
MFKDENAVMKNEIKKMREQLRIDHEILQERAKEIFELQSKLKKFSDKMEIIVKDAREI